MAHDDDHPARPATTAVHGGEARPFWGDGLLVPVVGSSTFTFGRVADLVAFKRGEREHAEYGRYGNPTVRVVERKLAALEGAEDCLLLGSGMAAIQAIVMTVLKQGAHVVLMQDMYAGTRALFELVLPRFGIAHTIVPLDNPAALEAAIRPETALLFTELPTNPHLHVPNLAAILDVAKRHRLTSVVDATLATPLLCRPLEHGADLVVHSATKYLGGHNDLLAGSIAGAAPMIEAIREVHGLLGAVLAPQEAALLNRGLKTLPVRVARHCQSAAELSSRLVEHPHVAAVYYPGMADAGDAELAERYLPRGRGGLLSLRPRGGAEAAQCFVDALRVVVHAGSLGGVESLVQIPYLFTAFDLSPEESLARGLEDDLIRLSVGLEDVEDLWADVDQALRAAHR